MVHVIRLVLTSLACSDFIILQETDHNATCPVARDQMPDITLTSDRIRNYHAISLGESAMKPADLTLGTE